jgi:hypothetical protein
MKINKKVCRRDNIEVSEQRRPNQMDGGAKRKKKLERAKPLLSSRNRDHQGQIPSLRS